MKEYVEVVMGIVNSADDFKPAIEKGSKALQSYGPDVYELFHRIAIGMADIKADVVARFESKGFTRDEAIVLASDQWAEVKKSFAQNKKSGS